jgi:hypothetical protein
MPTNRPNRAPDPTPNSSAPPSTKKRSSERVNPSDYPSYAQQRTANPLAQPAKSLTNPGWALKHLGLTEEDVKGVPEITPRVKEAMGSVKEAILLLRGDDAPDSRAFIEKWDSLSARDQSNCRLEHVITAAKLTTRRFMELLAGASFDHSATVSKIFISQSQLKVMKSTVKAATAAKGDVKAMEIFHKITGAMPTPKGGTFVFNPQINPPPPDANQPKTPLQAMDSFLLELDDVRRPKQLSASIEPVIPVEMPENAPEIEYLDLGEVV